jgi:putative ABC transport system ATP-binding protein
MMSYLKIDGIEKTLEKNQILKGIHLEINKGEIMALVGPSGSGKSTLLRCINRLIEVDKGKILLNRKDIREIPPVSLRRSVVLVHQDSIMLNGTVYDNIAFGPSLKGPVDKKQILKCMKDVGLSYDFLQKNANKLSGGEKKRVALARALALGPNVLLLDEPASGIDPKKVETVEKNIVDFSRKRKLTVVWVTHNVDQAKRISERIANLKDGKIREVRGTPEFHWEGAY